MRNLIIALVIGIIIGAAGWAWLRPGPGAVQSSGQETYTINQVDSIRTHIKDSIATFGKITTAGAKTRISGPGKKDTIYTAYHDTVSYEEYLQATMDQTEAIERQTNMYREWLDSLKANNSRDLAAITGGTAKEKWLGISLIAGVSGPVSSSYKPEEAYLGPDLRFGKHEFRIIPSVGYNWKAEKPWKVMLSYKIPIR